MLFSDAVQPQYRLELAIEIALPLLKCSILDASFLGVLCFVGLLSVGLLSLSRGERESKVEVSTRSIANSHHVDLSLHRFRSVYTDPFYSNLIIPSFLTLSLFVVNYTSPTS